MIESPRLSPSIFCCKIKNYIVEGDKLKANHDYRWGGHESVFCKSKTLNSQYLGLKTVRNMRTSRGKDSQTVLPVTHSVQALHAPDEGQSDQNCGCALVK